MADFAEVRAEAKELGINAYQKGKSQLEQEIAAYKGETIKKGAASWKPARMLDVRNKQAGYRHRWVDKDPQRVEKMVAEGWVIVDKTSGIKAEHDAPSLVDGGKLPEGANSYRDLVLMALPDEIGEARDDYYREKAKKQVEGVNVRARQQAQDVGDKMTVHKGELEITRIT